MTEGVRNERARGFLNDLCTRETNATYNGKKKRMPKPTWMKMAVGGGAAGLRASRRAGRQAGGAGSKAGRSRVEQTTTKGNLTYRDQDGDDDDGKRVAAHKAANLEKDA